MLKTKVGYSKIADAYEAGVETAKNATEEMSAKVGLLFNSVGYDQKKLMEGIKSVIPDIDVIGCTSSAGIITPEGYMIDEAGTAGMLTLDDEELTVACYGMPKGKSARETGREVALKALEKAIGLINTLTKGDFNVISDEYKLNTTCKSNCKSIKGCCKKIFEEE